MFGDEQRRAAVALTSLPAITRASATPRAAATATAVPRRFGFSQAALVAVLALAMGPGVTQALQVDFSGAETLTVPATGQLLAQTEASSQLAAQVDTMATDIGEQLARLDADLEATSDTQNSRLPDEKSQPINSQEAVGAVRPGLLKAKVIQEPADLAAGPPAEIELRTSAQNAYDREHLKQKVKTSLAQVTSMVETATESAVSDFRDASGLVYDYVQELTLKNAKNPVSEAHALFLLIFSVVAIIMFCASTTVCVRVARDSNIAANALSIRKRYQRNMQLYLILKQKNQMDKQAERIARGGDESPNSQSMISMSEESSAVVSSSRDQSYSQDFSGINLYPADMIIEKSSADEEDSYMEDSSKNRRGLDLLVNQENMSLVEEDYVIVDHRQRMSFFEERLQAMEALEVRSPSPPRGGGVGSLYPSPVQNSSAIQLHVSQLSAAGLTENSEEDDLEDEDDRQSQGSVEHFTIEANLTEAEP